MTYTQDPAGSTGNFRSSWLETCTLPFSQQTHVYGSAQRFRVAVQGQLMRVPSLERRWGCTTYGPSLSSAGLCAVLFVLGSFTACLVLQIVNSADHYELNVKLGLRPRNVQSLLDFVPASFLHLSWNHFEGNGLDLLVVGFFAAYQGIGKLLAVTAVVLVTSCLFWWLFGPLGTYSVGASGTFVAGSVTAWSGVFITAKSWEAILCSYLWLYTRLPLGSTSGRHGQLQRTGERTSVGYSAGSCADSCCGTLIARLCRSHGRANPSRSWESLGK